MERTDVTAGADAGDFVVNGGEPREPEAVDVQSHDRPRDHLIMDRLQRLKSGLVQSEAKNPETIQFSADVVAGMFGMGKEHVRGVVAGALVFAHQALTHDQVRGLFGSADITIFDHGEAATIHLHRVGKENQGGQKTFVIEITSNAQGQLPN